MKRIVALLLAAVLVLTCTSALAAKNEKKREPQKYCECRQKGTNSHRVLVA